MTQCTFVIAEIGVNHNGDIERARELVRSAAACGADAVKFQTFRAEQLVSKTAQKAEYQQRTTGSAQTQYEMLKALELSPADHTALRDLCGEMGIEFMSTPFDAPSANLLVEELGVKRIKVASGEITNGPFLLELAQLGRPILLSTGMSTIAEIERALDVLAHGLLNRAGPPALGFWEDADAKAALADKVTLLHCTTEYPAPFEDANLRTMRTMAAHFGLRIGFSDHTTGISVAIASVACGARVVEKHFTLDRSLPGPDHQASITPEEFREMVAGIRAVELALGDGEKKPAACEMKNIAIARRILVAARPIKKGTILASSDIAARRAGGGLSPMSYWDVLGRPAIRNFDAGECLEI